MGFMVYICGIFRKQGVQNLRYVFQCLCMTRRHFLFVAHGKKGKGDQCKDSCATHGMYVHQK